MGDARSENVPVAKRVFVLAQDASLFNAAERARWHLSRLGSTLSLPQTQADADNITIIGAEPPCCSFRVTERTVVSWIYCKYRVVFSLNIRCRLLCKYHYHPPFLTSPRQLLLSYCTLQPFRSRRCR
jgi:hypothetical protein